MRRQLKVILKHYLVINFLLVCFKVWERADEFVPERFDLDGPVPNETNTDYRYMNRTSLEGPNNVRAKSSNTKYLYHRFIPFSGGPRKCVGDQFALLEAIVALAVVLQHLTFDLVPDQTIGMTTGATIHTTNVTFSHPLSHFFFKPLYCIWT